MSSFAERLWNARVTGGTITAGPEDMPDSVEAAFAIQDAVAKAGGLPRGGWKVGSTSIAMMKKFGATEPAPAPMYRQDCLDSPATLKVFAAHNPMVEAEIAFRLGKDLPARATPYTPDEVAAAVDGVAPCFEVVGSRLTTGMLTSGRLLLLADNGANIGFVAGKWIADWRGIDLAKVALTMSVNGKQVSDGIGEKAMGNPFNVMAWIANHLSKRGYGMHKGEVVSSGSLSSQAFVHDGDVADADFGALGKVTVTIKAV